MSLTVFLARFLGAYMLAMSAWLLLRREVALRFVDRIAQNPASLAVVGMIRLAIGLAIVIGHDRWGGAVATLVTLVGWVTLLSGLTTLLAPPETTRALFARMRLAERLPAFALISFLLGAALLIGGYAG